MSNLLISLGHGKSKNGAYDPGANGNGTTEAEFLRGSFFTSLKKYAGNKIDFYENDMYGSREAQSITGYKEIIELHLDAASASAKGGHVIIAKGFNPDALDKRLGETVKRNFGLRANTMFDNRNDLLNLNVFAKRGISYRLVELCFITNKENMDYFKVNYDKVAKELVQDILNMTITTRPIADKPVAVVPKPIVKTIKVGKQAKQWQTGEDIKSFVIGGTYDVLQEKAVNQSKSKKAYLIGKGEVATGWLLEQDVDGFKAPAAAKPTTKNKHVYLPKSAKTWRVYKTSGPYTVGKEVGFLAPAQYGGLDYEIIKTLVTDVYEIKTGAFGNVAIYAAKSTGATIK